MTYSRAHYQSFGTEKGNLGTVRRLRVDNRSNTKRKQAKIRPQLPLIMKIYKKLSYKGKLEMLTFNSQNRNRIQTTRNVYQIMNRAKARQRF
jgi:hypothetical protein